MSEFGDAFKAARKAGKMTFEYKGKKYGTRLANETKEQHRKKMSAQSPLSRDIMQESGKNTGYKGKLKPVPAKEKAVSVPRKSMPKVVESKPAPAKAVKKKSTAPRSGSAVSRTQREDALLRQLDNEAVYLSSAIEKKKKKSAEAEKFVGKKPKAVIKEDMREGYKKERSVRGRKESAQDFERFKAMKGYAADRKKVKAVADKYKDVLARAMKVFMAGGSLKEVPADAVGLSKLPTAVRNKMGYAKKGSKMPSYGYGGKMKKAMYGSKMPKKK